jgi:hypothetical protein
MPDQPIIHPPALPAVRRRRRRVSPALAAALVALALAAAIAPALLPGTLVGREAVPVAAAAIFAGRAIWRWR